MSIERWIFLCAVFAVESFFAKVMFVQSVSQDLIDNAVSRQRGYEEAWDTLDRRDKEWSTASREGRVPNLLPSYEPSAFGRGVSRWP
jgi:hypothetical protein